MALATLSIDLTASLARFEQGMAKSVQVSQSTADRISGAFTGITRAAGALGVAAAAAMAVLQFRSSIDTADRLDDLAEKYGVAAGKLSEYRFAAEVAGTPTDSLAQGLNKLSKSMSEGNRAFDLIGVSTKGAGGSLRSVDDVLVDIADRFAGYTDGAAKAALATAIFGKSGADLIPLLNKGGEGIRGLRSEAVQLGAAFGSELAKAAGEFNDNLAKLKLASEGAKIALVGDLLPALHQITVELIEGKKAYGSWLSALLDIGLNTDPAKTAWENLADTNKEINRLKDNLAEIERRSKSTSWIDQLNNVGMDTQSAKMKENLANLEKRKRYLEAIRPLEEFKDTRARPSDLKGNAPALGDAEAAKETVKQYDSLVTSIRERTTASEEELATGAKITEYRRFEIQALEKLGAMNTNLSEAQRTAAVWALNLARIRNEEVDTQRTLNTAREHSNKLTADTVKQVGQEVASRIQANEALRNQAEEYGKTADQVEDLRTARLAEAAAVEEQALAMAINAGAAQDEIDARKQNLTLLRQQITLRRQQADIERGDRGNALVGAQRAVNDYLLSIQQAGTETERAVSSSIGALENDLTNSLVSGTFSVRSFVNTALAEFTRLAVVRPLMQSLLGDGGGGSLIGSAIKFISGGRATGGPVAAGRMYEVNERGAPELLNIGNRQLLMMGKQSGTVTPTSAAGPGGGGGGGGLTVNNYVSGGMSRGEVLQAIQLASKQTYATIRGELVQRRVIV